MIVESMARGRQDLATFLRGRSLSKGIPLSDQVYGLLRRAIVTGRLAPGSTVGEIEIAKHLGISRTPVREAVKKVEDEGLIEVRGQAGTFVSPIDADLVREAYIIRMALERESVRRAAMVIDDTQVQRFRELIEMHAVVVKRTRFEDAIEHDDAFHRAMAEVNGYPMMWKVIELTKAQMDRCRVLAMPSPGAGDATIEQHTAIVDALERRDPDAAVEALQLHIETSLANTLEVLERKDVPVIGGA